MSRLIDADAYSAEMKQLQDACYKWLEEAKAKHDWEGYEHAQSAFGVFAEAKLTLDKMPTIDAVQVVRCKECKHRWENGGDCVSEPDWFCADGVRKHE